MYNFVTFKYVVITGRTGFVASDLSILLWRTAPELSVTALDNPNRRGAERHV
jgi:hypothetical protein